MIYKCTNGFVIFQFESIQEMEMLGDIIPFPDLVPYSDKPLTFVPAEQAKWRYFIAGTVLNPFATVIKSCADVIKGFKENRFCYSIAQDGVISRDLIDKKVSLQKNEFDKYYCNFLLQPYSMVGLWGRATDFECVYKPSRGVFVFSYIRFAYE